MNEILRGLGRIKFGRRGLFRGATVAGGAVVAGATAAKALEAGAASAQQTRKVLLPVIPDPDIKSPPTPEPGPTPVQRLSFEQYHAQLLRVDSEAADGVETQLLKTPNARFSDDFVDALRGNVARKVAEHSRLNNNLFQTAKVVICKDENDMPQGQNSGWVEISISQGPPWEFYGIGFMGSRIINSMAILYFAPRSDLNESNARIDEGTDNEVGVGLFTLTKSGRSHTDTDVLAGDTDTVNLINSRPLLLTRS